MEPTLTQLLQNYHDRPDRDLVVPIFTALSQTQVYVPASMGKQGAVYTQGDSVGLKPDTIPGPEGKVIFPCFSDPSQVPNDYGTRFSFLRLTFPEFAAAALDAPNFGGMVLDPFTAKFMIPEEISRTLYDDRRELQ